MATLSNTYGITLVVGTSSTEYGGAASNQFFGGSSDRIAMLRYGAPDVLGENEVLTAASFTGWFKADSGSDADNITIGLVDAAWTTTTTTYATLIGYIEATTTTDYLSVTTTSTEKTLDITPLLQAWAANPSSYSGIYFRCSTLNFSRIGATDQYISTTVETRTATSAPTTVNLASAMAAPGGTVSLSWSGASAGHLNPVAGYYIARSENGGAYDEDWQTDSASPYNVTAHATYGNYYRYKLITRGDYIDSAISSAYVTLTTYTPTDCGAPSTATLNKTVAETAPTLTYSGASSGTINTITGYEIEYAESANNSTWGAWTALKTVSNTGTSGTTTVNLSSTRGYYRKYRIRTQGSAGSSYYSDWKETTSCRYNSLPTAPTVFAASPAVYVSGTIALAYSGATDADNNISTYNVQYATSADGSSWSGWTSLADGATSHSPTLSPGHYIKYQVRTVDAFAVTSGWKASNICGKNTAPAAPAITYPQNGQTIYNSRPRFMLTIGADPEAHTQSIAASGFTASTASGLSGSAKTIMRLSSAASAGTVSISAVSTDQYAESSSAAARDTTYVVSSFTDATIESGTTAIKAAHMTELRDMINTVRVYYGLPVYFPGGTNLCSGWDFESGVGGWAANNATSSVGDGSAFEVYDGKNIIITSDTGGTNNGAWYAFAGFEVGKSYTLSGQFICHAGWQMLCSSDMSHQLVIPASTVWEHRSLTFVPQSTSGWIYFLFPGIAGGWTRIFVDNLKLEKGTQATPWASSVVTSGYPVWYEPITAKVTKTRNWAAHITEMQEAIDDIVTAVNSWDTASTTHRIILPAWISPTSYPRADVMEQIRAAIPLL